jgi:DNA polymerase III delta prime subunit
MRDDFLWVEKYRPKTVEECILPIDIKDAFEGFLQQGEIPNLLLSGSAGSGKTTVAKAICEQLGCDYILINGSDEGRFIDTVRNTIKNYASTVSLQTTSKHKVIIIDEADNTTNDVQLCLRANIEAFHANCRFIFTCNYKNKIIEPLHSRCSCLEFGIKGNEKIRIATKFFRRVCEILVEENIKFDEKVVAELINKYFPDWRRLLNELQRYSSNGEIGVSILVDKNSFSTNELIKSLKTKQFLNVRKWIVQNLDSDPNVILKNVYNCLYDHMKENSIPEAVLIIAKYQYQTAFVADHEINLLAALTELMCNCEFK